MSKIEWTDHTLNPLVGCTHASAGCKNCYAESASKTGRLQQFSQYHGVVDERGHWTGKINFVPAQLEKLFKFRKPTRVFMSDPFHPAVKDERLDQIFAAIALNPQVTVQMLTKRPERMLEYISSLRGVRLRSGLMRLRMQLEGIPDPRYNMLNDEILPLKNLHPGVSIENQKTADERIPLLLQTPAALRFLSLEPLLEAVNLTKRQLNGNQYNYLLNSWSPYGGGSRGATAGGRISTLQSAIDWVIVGGESGSGARLCDTDWIYSIVEQCQSSRVPVFVKQMGSKVMCECRTPEHPDWDELGPIYRISGKGGDMQEWPERLRVREFPEGE
jgi:protein gp37